MGTELKPVLYANLASEMAKYGLTIKDIADKTGLYYNKLQNMILDRTPFSIGYMTTIRDTFFPDKTMDVLFKRFEK
jgi:hypothetical protein